MKSRRRRVKVKSVLLLVALSIVSCENAADRAVREQREMKQAARGAAVEKRVAEAAVERKAKERKAQEQFNGSPAGRICREHPGWSQENCEQLARGATWVGMSAEMADVAFERYRHIKKVNMTQTANGVHEQWVYSFGSAGNIYIYVDNGVVTAFQY